MAAFAELMVLPVPVADKRAAFAAETGWMSHRMDDFERSRANAGVTIERVSLVETPVGSITISYLEGSRSYRDVAQAIRTAPSVFDQDMMTRGKVLHGLSEAQQLTERRPLELSVDYAVALDKRRPWHSFAAWIRPGLTDRWRELCAELGTGRRAQLDEFGARNGYVVFRAGLYQAPKDDLACFYIEGTNDTRSLPQAILAGGAFESWFAGEFQAIHGVDIRQGLPSPAVGVPWDWVKGETNDPVAPLFASFAALFPN